MFEKWINDLQKKFSQTPTVNIRGAFYSTIFIVFEDLGKDRNIGYDIEKICQALEISPTANLQKDEETLAKITPTGKLSKYIQIDHVCTHVPLINSLFITFYDKEVLFYVLVKEALALFYQDPNILTEKNNIIAPTSIPNNTSSLGLALILWRDDLEEIEIGKSLTCNEVLQLVDKAIYFLCDRAQKLENVQKKTNFLNDKMDHESEQGFLVIISFTEPYLKENEIFKSKLPLKNFLKNIKTGFQIITLQTVIQTSGLIELGFVRV